MSNLTSINVFIVFVICLVIAEHSNVRADFPEFCLLSPISTAEKKCKGYIKKWTFNATEDACVSYIYGGCHGTKNLFETEEECQAACPSLPQKVIELPKKQGGIPNSSSSVSFLLAHQHHLVAMMSCLILVLLMRSYQAKF